MVCAQCGLRDFCAESIARLTDDDERCLRHIWALRYGRLRNCPRCNKFCTYHRCRNKKCWQCSQCAHQLSPLANTIFHKSTTPLSKWFYAMEIMHNREVRIVELQRELHCTYKTAWRMFWRIHTLFSNTNLEQYLHSVDRGAELRDNVRKLQEMSHERV